MILQGISGAEKFLYNVQKIVVTRRFQILQSFLAQVARKIMAFEITSLYLYEAYFVHSAC